LLLGIALASPGCAGRGTVRPESGTGPLACPPSPNCVSSRATDEQHFVAALAFEGDAAEALRRLEKVVASMSGVSVVTVTDRAIHAEFRSRIFRFVDDVDLVADAARGVVDVRSASRVGYSDLGANRRRVEAIRQKFGDSSP
jgi:uncharacterized protein (DUF1499 family)